MQIIDAVLVCPSCRSPQAVDITANPHAESMPRWRGYCSECAQGWDFDDQ